MTKKNSASTSVSTASPSWVSTASFAMSAIPASPSPRWRATACASSTAATALNPATKSCAPSSPSAPSSTAWSAASCGRRRRSGARSYRSCQQVAAGLPPTATFHCILNFQLMKFKNSVSWNFVLSISCAIFVSTWCTTNQSHRKCPKFPAIPYKTSPIKRAFMSKASQP